VEDLFLELPCAHGKTALVVVTDEMTNLVRSTKGISQEMAQDVVYPVALLRRRGWTVAAVHRKTMECKNPERYRKNLIRRVLDAEASLIGAIKRKPYDATLIHLDVDTDSD